MANLHLVIMAGGSGTRFWPKSTSRRPKQLLAFGGGPTLLNRTLDRFDGLVPLERRMIVTTAALAPAVTDVAPGARVMGEPTARNTAPCVYWAAREVAARDPRGVMLVMPADHSIAFADRFAATVRAAAEWAATHDDLVTLGVKPTRPETGYGYLRTGEARGAGALQVSAFVEKPDLVKAEGFLKAGNYLWNGGMFAWRADVILAAFDRFMPGMREAWDRHGGDILKAYPEMPATSIDYGVMEKATNVVTFPLDCGWDDLGSWTSVEEMADALGARRGDHSASAGDVISVDSKGCIVDAPEQVVCLLGVEDLIVVRQGQTILIARKDRAQDIKQMVDEVKRVRPELA